MIIHSLSVLLLTLLLLPTSLSAEVYSYKDASGKTYYTNMRVDGRVRLKENVRLESVLDYGSLSGRGPSASRGRYGVSPRAVHRYIDKIARYHKIDPLLIKAIIKTESNFDPYAVSSQGAQGLMQLMPGTAKDLKVNDPFDVHQNIDGGTRYFKKLLHAYHGNLELSLAAYNAGPGRVKPFGSIPSIPETKAYVSKVLRYYRSYGGYNRLGSINVRNMVTVN